MINHLVSVLLIVPTVPFMTPQDNLIALNEKEVEGKLDTILVFSPHEKKRDKKGSKAANIKNFTFNVNGKDTKIYFAAFSPSAISELNSNILSQSVNPPKDIKNEFDYVPTSLAKFDSLIKEELEKGIKAEIIYVPDPDQNEYSKKLLLKQGVSKDIIDDVLRNNPIVFCPKPVVRATQMREDNTKISYIPCSTDYITLKGLVDQTKTQKKNWFSREKKPEIIAITLNQFRTTLKNSDDLNVRDLRVIPSPSSYKIIKQLEESN